MFCFGAGCIAGKGLKACDGGKTSDPYCSIKFYDHTQHKSQTIKKTLNPEWNEPNLYTWTGRIAGVHIALSPAILMLRAVCTVLCTHNIVVCTHFIVMCMHFIVVCTQCRVVYA